MGEPKQKLTVERGVSWSSVLSKSPAFDKTENLQTLSLHEDPQKDRDVMFAFAYLLR